MGPNGQLASQFGLSLPKRTEVAEYGGLAGSHLEHIKCSGQDIVHIKHSTMYMVVMGVSMPRPLTS